MWNSCNTNDKSFNKVCDSHQENVMKYSLGGDEEMGSRSHYIVDIKYLEFQTILENDICKPFESQIQNSILTK